MTPSGIGLLAVLFAASLQPAMGAQAPATQALDYDTYCQKPPAEKRELFRAMTVQQKTVIWQTQVERYRDANQKQLTAEQLALIKEFHAAIPESFAPKPQGEALAAKLAALEARLRRAFSNVQQREMDQFGPCIPRAVK